MPTARADGGVRTGHCLAGVGVRGGVWGRNNEHGGRNGSVRLLICSAKAAWYTAGEGGSVFVPPDRRLTMSRDRHEPPVSRCVVCRLGDRHHDSGQGPPRCQVRAGRFERVVRRRLVASVIHPLIVVPDGQIVLVSHRVYHMISGGTGSSDRASVGEDSPAHSWIVHREQDVAGTRCRGRSEQCCPAASRNGS